MSDRDATADWLLSVQGRIARIVAGSLLIIIGLGVIGGFLGVLLLIIGAIPIASAAYGALLIGPLFGRDIRGRRPSEQRAEEKQSDDAEEDGGEEPAEADRSEEDRSSGEDTAEADHSAGKDRSGEDRSGDDEPPRKEPDAEWSAPPLARAERPEGQGPRTRDLRTDEPAGSSDDSEG